MTKCSFSKCYAAQYKSSVVLYMVYKGIFCWNCNYMGIEVTINLILWLPILVTTCNHVTAIAAHDELSTHPTQCSEDCCKWMTKFLCHTQFWLFVSVFFPLPIPHPWANRFMKNACRPQVLLDGCVESIFFVCLRHFYSTHDFVFYFALSFFFFQRRFIWVVERIMSFAMDWKKTGGIPVAASK